MIRRSANPAGKSPPSAVDRRGSNICSMLALATLLCPLGLLLPCCQGRWGNRGTCNGERQLELAFARFFAVTADGWPGFINNIIMTVNQDFAQEELYAPFL